MNERDIMGGLVRFGWFGLDWVGLGSQCHGRNPTVGGRV